MVALCNISISNLYVVVSFHCGHAILKRKLHRLYSRMSIYSERYFPQQLRIENLPNPGKQYQEAETHTLTLHGSKNTAAGHNSRKNQTTTVTVCDKVISTEEVSDAIVTSVM